ncbi:MAG: winged helix-turn-helix domain-containing protein [Saprospiraceae bacterium]|nr:winged helix-turn-helix domain-containing protein [Saprospiraceae bacterium]
MPDRSYSAYLNGVDTEFRFDHFTFLPETGDLIFLDSAGKNNVSRLPPQPSRLLALLVSRYPEMVSHEEIKEAVWPEVEVDFERSLHFCIRQIRAALQDNASDPVYIETIPRRGYRWLVQPVTDNFLTETAGRKFPKTIFWVLILLPLAGIVWFWKGRSMDQQPNSSKGLRIAIMPFIGKDSNLVDWSSAIALNLVDELSNSGQGYQVVGPTTTVNFKDDGIPELIRDYAIDYVINGRFILRNDTTGVLAEVIRGRDGAHVWVRYYAPYYRPDSIIQQIRRGLPNQ